MGRLIWFGLGALAATWYIRSKEERAAACGMKKGQWVNSGPYQYQSNGGNNPNNSQNVAQGQPQTEKTENQVHVDARFDVSDRERLRELGNQASEVLSDVSETVLETAFATIDNLRNRLAEQRAIRDRALKDQQEAEQRRFV